MERSAQEVGPLALACSPDGDVVVVSDGAATRIEGGAVLHEWPAAIAFGAGAIWTVARGETGHELRVFDRSGRPRADPYPLGELGPEVAIAAGSAGALVHGFREVLAEVRRGGIAIEASARPSALAIEQLRPGGRDRRLLLGERGVVERRGEQLVAMHGRHPPLALPEGRIIGGRAVLGGVWAAVEIAGAARQLVVYDLRRSTVRTTLALGGGAVAAIAERRGVAVIARGARLEVVDLGSGAPVIAHELPCPIACAAVDADGRRLFALDARGALHRLDARPAEAAAAGSPRAPLDVAAYSKDLEDLVVAWADRAYAMRTKGPKGRAAAILHAKLTERELAERWGGVTDAPHNQLAAEFGLSPLELSLLLAVAVPHGWCRATERVGALGGGPRHGGTTELVLSRLVAAGAAQATVLRAALEPAAPLVRCGLVRVGPGERPCAPVTPSPQVVQRLLGLEAQVRARPALPRCRSTRVFDWTRGRSLLRPRPL